MTTQNDKTYNCANCKYSFMGTETDQWILCRRFPPQVHQSEVDIPRDENGKINANPRQTIAQFPVVNASNWCGEHARKKEG